ncbi:MAG: hypothetical protein OHK0039_47880 [Bacteroidia bacterium]
MEPYLQGLPSGPIVNTTGIAMIEVKATSSYPVEAQHFTVLRNDRPYSPESKLGNASFDVASYRYRLPVSLQEGDNRVRVIVRNAAGEQQTETIVFSYQPTRPNLYVLAVGSQTNLQYAARDAQDFAELFQRQALQPDRLFEQIEVQALIGAEATKSAIDEAIERFGVRYRTQNLSERDVLILFFSTHGAMNNGQFYLQAENYEPGMYRSTAVDFANVRAILNETPCKKLLLIDACQSGGARTGSAAEINQAIAALDQASGTAIMTSSQASELSWEDAAWENGAFTEAVLQGMADSNRNGIVTLHELSTYVIATVPPMVLQRKDAQQHPRLMGDLGDIPLFVLP